MSELPEPHPVASVAAMKTPSLIGLGALLVACGSEVPFAGTTGGGGSGGEPTATTTVGVGGASTSTAGGGGAGGAPMPKTFRERYALEATWPEGGIYDPQGHAFYVGSLGDGSVHRVDAQSGLDETIFVETAPGAWWTLGMAIDPTQRKLWVCAMEDLRGTNADPAYDGYVWRFDLATGAREAVYPLAEAYAEATCTDVTVADDGTVYVVDRDFGRVYRIGPGDGAATPFVEDDELEASIIGQNAAVVTPDQSALLVAIYLPSRLVRVDLTTKAVTEVDIDGSFGDITFLSGADGMTLHDGKAYVVFSSELVEITPTLGDWSTASAREVSLPNGLTDVVSTPEGLYLLNGQAVRYALEDDPDPFALVRFTGSFPSE